MIDNDQISEILSVEIVLLAVSVTNKPCGNKTADRHTQVLEAQ